MIIFTQAGFVWYAVVDTFLRSPFPICQKTGCAAAVMSSKERDCFLFLVIGTLNDIQVSTYLAWVNIETAQVCLSNVVY